VLGFVEKPSPPRPPKARPVSPRAVDDACALAFMRLLLGFRF